MTYLVIQSPVFILNNICWALWSGFDLATSHPLDEHLYASPIRQLYSFKPFRRAMEFNIAPVCLSTVKPQIVSWNIKSFKLKYSLSPWGSRPHFIPNVVCSCKCDGRKLLTCTLNENTFLSATANLAHVGNPRQFWGER